MGWKATLFFFFCYCLSISFLLGWLFGGCSAHEEDYKLREQDRRRYCIEYHMMRDKCSGYFPRNKEEYQKEIEEHQKELEEYCK